MTEEEKKEAENSLESSLETEQEQTTESLNQSGEDVPQQSDSKPARQKKVLTFARIIRKRNTIYLSLFVVLILALLAISYVAYRKGNNTQPQITSQSLSPSTLSKLANNNTVIGTNNQLLTIGSSSIFNGPILVKNNLSVSNNIVEGGNLQVSGTSDLSQLQISHNLSVSGNASIQGTLTVQNNLNVNGNGNFSGNLSATELNINSIQLNGDLLLNHHLVTSGAIPNISTLSGVGPAGTSSISGSDTAGTITINTGTSPVAGCYISVNFSAPFANTPSVLLTPSSTAAANINYYVNRSATSFSVCSVNTPAPEQSLIFGYMVID